MSTAVAPAVGFARPSPPALEEVIVGANGVSTLVNDRRSGHLRAFALYAGLGAAAIGFVALAGWILGMDVLKSVVPGLVTMKANTALTFVVGGLSLHVALRSPDSRAGRAAVGGALFALLLAGAITSQYIHGRDLGIDLLLFDEPHGATGTAFPGRMAVNTGVCFVVVSLAILSMRSRAAGVVPVLGMLVAGCGVLALTGYATGITSLYGLEGVTQMAVPTATGFVLLGSALICGQPTSGPMQLLTSDGAGGSLARRLLPAIVAGVFVVVTLRLIGQEVGLYGTKIGVWLTASGFLALMLPIVWRVSWSLERTDAQRREALQKLTRLAERDPLTRLFNRRRFEEDLNRHIALAVRHQRPFALVTIDLDGFKQVNDTFGHQAGDQLLIRVADVLRSELRGGDTAGRLGGDEFVVLLPETSLAGARIVASKLCASISSLGRISASIGGVVCEDEPAVGMTSQAMHSLVDAELYRAKNEGGDVASIRTIDPGEASRQRASAT